MSAARPAAQAVARAGLLAALRARFLRDVDALVAAPAAASVNAALRSAGALPAAVADAFERVRRAPRCAACILSLIHI